MAIQDNKAAIRRFFEQFMGQGDAQVARDVIAADVVSHSSMPGQRPGVEGVIDTITMFRTAFSDFTIDIKKIIAEEDTVMSYVIVTGVHTGEFMGMPATNKNISYEEMTVFRFDGDKVVEHWAVADAYALMQQIGALPS